MSMISEQVKELRKVAKWFDSACFPEGVKLANEAADTIESLSAKLQAANMERSAEDCGGWIPCKERLPEKEAKEYIKNELDGIGYLYPLLLTYRSPNTEKVHVVRFYWNVYDKEFVNNGEKTCDMDRCIAWKPLPGPCHEP